MDAIRPTHAYSKHDVRYRGRTHRHWQTRKEPLASEYDDGTKGELNLMTHSPETLLY